jgi:hypothetical protein
MSDIDICNVFKMMQEFKLIKHIILKNFSKFLYKNQKRFVLDLKPSKVLTLEEKNLKSEKHLGNIEHKVKTIMEDDLKETDRYLLASIFKNRPG